MKRSESPGRLVGILCREPSAQQLVFHTPEHCADSRWGASAAHVRLDYLLIRVQTYPGRTSHSSNDSPCSQQQPVKKRWAESFTNLTSALSTSSVAPRSSEHDAQQLRRSYSPQASALSLRQGQKTTCKGRGRKRTVSSHQACPPHRPSVSVHAPGAREAVPCDLAATEPVVVPFCIEERFSALITTVTRWISRRVLMGHRCAYCSVIEMQLEGWIKPDPFPCYKIAAYLGQESSAL